MNAKHTPGPWRLETVKTQVGVCHKVGEFPTRLAHRPTTSACVYEDGTSNWRLLENGTLDSELLANARLMTAAPDLLEALTLIACGADGPATARAAIAKAEGQPTDAERTELMDRR